MFFRPLNLGAPSAPSLYKLSVDEFKGVDKASGEDNFSPSRATDMQNFIRDKVGRVKKRGGFVRDANGIGVAPKWVDYWKDFRVHFDEDEKEVHIFKKENGLYKDLNKKISATAAIGYATGSHYYVICSVVCVINPTDPAGASVPYGIYRWNGSAWEGKNSLIVNEPPRQITTENRFLPIDGAVPEIVINSSPSGGGGYRNAPNVLSPLVIETFTVSKEDYDYSSKTDEAPDRCARFQLHSQNITLTYGNRAIPSEEWMSGQAPIGVTYTYKKKDSDEEETGNVYWTVENGVRKLTRLGELVLQRSIRIERYMLSDDSSLDEGDQAYEWIDRTVYCFAEGGTGFVNTEKGALWIPAANIGESPSEGEPSVRVRYIRNHEEYAEGFAELIDCNLSTCYGVGGYKDRVFLAGGNKIFYSGMDEPLFFGELCYIEPCSADKSIVAMGGQGQVLYAVDSDGITHVISGTTTEEDTNTFLLDAAFIIADRVQGEKPIGSVLKIFGGEFCYLSEEGVVAIRHDNFYDKRYAQNRSRMLGDSIKGQIVGATVWGSFLVIATETQLYLLDELQQTRLEDYKYSGVQYEVFPFAFDMDKLGDFTIERVWTDGEDLRLLVAKNGAFYELVYDETARQDTIDAEAADIIAEWITPQFQLADVHRRKLIQELFLSVGAEGDAVTVEYRTDNEDKWRTIRPADGRFVAFDYNSVDYGTFSYNVQVPKLQMIVRGRPDRRFYKIQFRFTSTGRHGLSLSSFGFYYKKEVI